MSWLHALAAAFGFLTRLPVPQRPLQPASCGRALVFFPVVGGVLGAAQAAVGAALVDPLTSALAAIAAVAFSALLTAGLHLDGLADLADGLAGSRGDAGRALSIMRDSRIGSFGALALVLVIAAKIAALDALLAARAWPAVLLAPVAARAAAVGLIVLLPYARAEGTGRAFADHGRPLHLAAAAALAALGAAALDPRLLLVMLAAWLGVALLGVWVKRRLGGMTGDGYGAAIELCEAAFPIFALGVR